MLNIARLRPVAGLAMIAALASASAVAQNDDDQGDRDSRQIKHVFVIAMENHNFTQPAQVPGKIQPIYQNPANPFTNSLINGTAVAWINGKPVNISEHTAYAVSYHNVLATQSGNNPHIHPSEPNYIWAEAGTNFGIANDADPYPSNVQNTTQHLSALLQKQGRTWKSYQEDIDLASVNGKLTNVPLPQSQWTVPLTSHSGLFDANSLLNAYNDTLQYNYAAKHNPQVFFTDTNGGNDSTPANPFAKNYAPLQQLEVDLANNTVADYNWITPNQYNDQHSALATGFAGLTGDASQLKTGDNALAKLVPMIMASKAYKDGGAIILWWDESEADGESGDNADDFNHTIPEIVISNLAHPNEAGLPYASQVDLTHSSDLRTMQEIFHVRAEGGNSPFLGDAANANDLSDLFAPGVIPSLH
ncbi:alkaline phosphatase family protein [Occallatibacter savannae]|uniref:alkaline phosphatase family protein n=1 Tax=Occallatibacter savannae TaxID=1002691 RepID=UPI000D69B695|nr:alkaline phosphatase family protein [Occallatibacter savannae]